MQNICFRGKAAYGTTENHENWPNVPLPFDGNQEEPSVYKVLLSWDLNANKVFRNYATTIE